MRYNISLNNSYYLVFSELEGFFFVKGRIEGGRFKRNKYLSAR